MTAQLTKSNGQSMTVAVEKAIDKGNWIQLRHFGAKRLYMEHPRYFKASEDMKNGETQLTLADGVTLEVIEG